MRAVRPLLPSTAPSTKASKTAGAVNASARR